MAHEARRAAFLSLAKESRPICYVSFPALTDPARAQKIKESVAYYKNAGCSTLVPQLPKGTELTDTAAVAALGELYAILLAAAQEAGLQVGFYLDPAIEARVVRAMENVEDFSLHARLLECKEYICREQENVKRKMPADGLLSLVAYSEGNFGDVIDLRPYVADGELCFEVPHGNWIIKEYRTRPEENTTHVNYLSYAASLTYLHAAFSLFAPVFTPYLGNTLTLLCYTDIGFNGTNRRDWDASFHTLFERKHGFDPAPFYPALFGDYIGGDTEHIKAMLIEVRGSMIANGIIAALWDFATELGLNLFGNLTEPKQTACSFTVGDAMQNCGSSPCALFDNAYLYGTNSVKIAAGAAYNLDIDRVNGELFRNYTIKESRLLYKDAMNAFARGVNNTALHLTAELADTADFCSFVTRTQALLRGGKHVADIAMLYPIFDLHSHTNLYTYPTEGFEYAANPARSDYMTLINAISFYAGHDLTVLHPKTLQKKCRTENGVLYLDNTQNSEEFRIVVMPSADMVSLENMRLLKRFFDGGGKLLATGTLPTHAFEYDKTGENDREVQRLVQEIFGEDACNKRVMKRYCYNKNEKDGEAIFLYFNASAVDGTYMTKSSTVNQALNSFKIPFDIYIPSMQRFEGTGALNSIFPEFHRVGLDHTFPGGGMQSHIHKRHDGGDIYYFSNTSDLEYNHHVLLRGAHLPEIWDPHTGSIQKQKSRLYSYLGEIYTYLRLTLPAQHSTFICTSRYTPEGEEIPELKSIDHLQSVRALRMSEF